MPQHSSPPERPCCTRTLFQSQTRLKCMYLHYKIPILYESWSRMHRSKDPNHITSFQGNVAFSRILYPPGDSVRIPGSSPPTTGWSDATDIPHRSPGPQSIYSYSRCRCKKPPDKGKCMYSLVDPPDPPQSYNLIQSNRKNRPFSNPSSWAVPKTWRSLERKQHKEIITCH
jgi:hypothetical protein